VTVVFFDRKARWEEAQLRERYPDYAEYASRTPRFVPGWPTH
jgi:protein-S-isoprenylcysteine O-methyltransferase Ste14